ncbi:hypothetical protein FIBSPDRAFT_289126 [Athelia psychrophila]|uniref:Uncharacterized protein n=1 Tax=Athelia psychrophila TaxID=1759441 RepID=A0A167XKM1_9AGAM|nr:hypothetical protein FIBSPDRAFT_289126 [Fibularhizoctonia sp. CBS 109695]
MLSVAFNNIHIEQIDFWQRGSRDQLPSGPSVSLRAAPVSFPSRLLLLLVLASTAGSPLMLLCLFLSDAATRAH